MPAEESESPKMCSEENFGQFRKKYIFFKKFQIFDKNLIGRLLAKNSA